jgi:hypothetical protein
MFSPFAYIKKKKGNLDADLNFGAPLQPNKTAQMTREQVGVWNLRLRASSKVQIVALPALYATGRFFCSVALVSRAKMLNLLPTKEGVSSFHHGVCWAPRLHTSTRLGHCWEARLISICCAGLVWMNVRPDNSLSFLFGSD